MAEIKVGAEVDARCSRCKMVLAHTVLAVWEDQIKRVRCNTCEGEHVYRAPPAKASAASSTTKKAASKTTKSKSKSKAKTSVKDIPDYETLTAGKKLDGARRYGVTEIFAVGDVIDHPSFGVGVVAGVRGLDKIDVAFPTGPKTLLHRRAAPGKSA